MTTKHQLDQLIEGVKRANDWSDPDLVRNAKERNYVLSKSNISRVRGPLVSIKADLIFALAAGLRVTPAQVAVAVMESMGIALPQYDTPTPEQSIRDDLSLSERDKDILLGLLKQLRGEATTRASTQAGQKEKTSDRAKRGYLDEAVGPDGIASGEELARKRKS